MSKTRERTKKRALRHSGCPNQAESQQTEKIIASAFGRPEDRQQAPSFTQESEPENLEIPVRPARSGQVVEPEGWLDPLQNRIVLTSRLTTEQMISFAFVPRRRKEVYARKCAKPDCDYRWLETDSRRIYCSRSHERDENNGRLKTAPAQIRGQVRHTTRVKTCKSLDSSEFLVSKQRIHRRTKGVGVSR